MQTLTSWRDLTGSACGMIMGRALRVSCLTLPVDDGLVLHMKTAGRRS